MKFKAVDIQYIENISARNVAMNASRHAKAGSRGEKSY